MRAVVGFIALASVALAGCGHAPRLLPGTGDKVVQGAPDVAYTEKDGVRFYADGAAWSGHPGDLGQVMTPVKVTVQNVSSHPVRIQYANFALVTPSGFRFPAIPPFSIDRAGPVRTAIVSPTFGYDHFYVDPWLHDYYPALSPWPYTFPLETSYGALWATWRAPLPSDDMLRAALPEGVLDAGGTVSGFLYFDAVANQSDRLRLDGKFVDAKDTDTVAKLDIPFRVVR